MPRKPKFSSEEIVDTAFQLLREGGWNALTAPAIAERLGCSTMPVYSHFKNMDDLEMVVLERAWDLLMQRETAVVTGDTWEDQAIAYARFAREEKHLFHCMFDGRHLDAGGDIRMKHWEFLDRKLEGYGPFQGLDKETAQKIRLARAMFSHGIATAVSTGWSKLFKDEEMTNRFLQVVSRAILAGMREVLTDLDKDFLTQKVPGDEKQ